MEYIRVYYLQVQNCWLGDLKFTLATPSWFISRSFGYRSRCTDNAHTVSLSLQTPFLSWKKEERRSWRHSRQHHEFIFPSSTTRLPVIRRNRPNNARFRQGLFRVHSREWMQARNTLSFCQSRWRRLAITMMANYFKNGRRFRSNTSTGACALCLRPSPSSTHFYLIDITGRL